MSQPLIFYDIPNQHSGQRRAWSPNTWKVRLALNYKRIPYRTVWVEYPDIKPLCLAIGAAQTNAGYTLPIIRDPNTERVVSDSWEITKYLDERYPERPVVPAGQDGLQYGFMFSPIHVATYDLVILSVCTFLLPRSQEYFRRTREADEGCTLEEYCAPGSKRDAHFAQLKAGYTQKARCYAKSGRWIAGDAPTWSDFVIAGWLLWARSALSAEEWTDVMGFDGGRWKTLLHDLEEYMNVDEGELYEV